MCYNKIKLFPISKEAAMKETPKRAALFLIILLFCLSSCSSTGPEPFDVQQARFDCNVRDLHSLNLINGLNLSKDQMQKMSPLLEESRTMESGLRKIKEERLARYNRILASLRERLMSHNDITEEQQKSLDEISLPIDRVVAANRDRMRILIGKVKEILNENQRLLLCRYEPCMVPTPNVSDPERIGGVVDSQKFGLELERLRKLDQKAYEKAKKECLDEKTMRMKVFNTREQIGSVISQMEKAMDMARTLDDAEFQMRRDELAAVKMPAAIRQDVEDDFICRYMLNPFLIEVFRKRM